MIYQHRWFGTQDKFINERKDFLMHFKLTNLLVIFNFSLVCLDVILN